MLMTPTQGPPHAPEEPGRTRPSPFTAPGSRVRRRAGGLLAAAVALPLLLTAAAAYLSWRQAWEAAQVELLRSADAAAEYAGRVLDGLVLRVDRANGVLAGLSDAEVVAREAALHAVLRSAAVGGLADGDRTPYVFVFDRDGYPLVASNIFPVPRTQSFMAREFNHALRDPGAPATHVSPIYVGTLTGEPYFAVTRRRERTGNGLPPAAYDGVVNASYYMVEANAGLRRLAGQEDLILSLVRSDGELLARSAGFDPATPRKRLGPDSTLLAAMTQGERRGIHLSRSTLDGAERIIAFRQVEGYPVYVAAGRERALVTALWWRATAPQLVVGGTATALLLLLALRVRRREEALAEANAVLEARVEERTAALAESEAQLRRVHQVSRVGGFEFDLRTGVNRRSAEYMAIQGRGAVPRLETHADWVARLHPEDRERAERRLLDAIATGAPDRDYGQDYRILTPEGEVRWILARAEIERDAAGRALRVVGAHVDVTELKLAQAAVAESEARLRAALRGARLGVWERHLPSGSGRWDARSVEIYGGLTVERCLPDFAEWRARIPTTAPGAWPRSRRPWPPAGRIPTTPSSASAATTAAGTGWRCTAPSSIAIPSPARGCAWPAWCAT
jgi:PAS domain S-box-containing protein